MSSINGILTILKAWHGLCGPDEVFSLGVMCAGNVQAFEKKSSVLSRGRCFSCDCLVSLPSLGHFDLPEGIVFSVPVTFKDGDWSVFKHVTVTGELEERLQLLASEVAEVHQGQKQPKAF